jgi:2-polyprenyl-3-methyl-5-hydroxy-6-metoxy-1,4-benzoquinol methylase
MKFDKVKQPLGFYQAAPLPTQEELDKYYSEKYFQDCPAKTYDPDYTEDERKCFSNKAAVSEHIWHMLKGEGKGTFMDVGCGEGFLLDYFAKKGWVVEGCDFSSFGVNKHHPYLMNCFIKGDVYKTLNKKIEEGHTYDFISLANVLEHVRFPLELLDSLRKIMHPKSILRVEVPNDFSPFQEFLTKKGLTKEHWFHPPDHLNYFTFESLKKVLESKKFRVLKMISDIPVEMFLLNNHSNYVLKPETGSEAHRSRVELFNFLVSMGLDKYVDYMSAAAGIGYGRSVIAFVSLEEGAIEDETDKTKG